MHRPSFSAAAFAVTAFLLIPSTVARADSAGAESADQGTSGAEPAAPAEATPTEATPAAPGGNLVAGGDSGGAAGADGSTQPEPPPAPAPAPEQVASPSGGDASTAPSPNESPPSTSAEPDESDGPGSSVSSDEVAEISVLPVHESSPDVRTDTSPTSEQSKPDPVGGVPTPSGDGRGGLESVLSGVERDIQKVQTQIEHIRRRLDAGASPPEGSLIRLRESLERIAPTLRALDGRLAATGRLSPELQRDIRRLRAELTGAQVSAADLIEALRRSGVHGAELRLLVRELASFGAFQPGPAWSLGADLGATPSPGGQVTQAQMDSGPARSRPHLAEAPLDPAARAGPATGSPRPGDVDEPAPWFSDSSATASPGGVFFVAGLASLACLLLGLAMPRLRAYLAVVPSRRYAATFLSPLERPG